MEVTVTVTHLKKSKKKYKSGYQSARAKKIFELLNIPRYETQGLSNSERNEVLQRYNDFNNIQVNSNDGQITPDIQNDHYITEERSQYVNTWLLKNLQDHPSVEKKRFTSTNSDSIQIVYLAETTKARCLLFEKNLNNNFAAISDLKNYAQFTSEPENISLLNTNPKNSVTTSNVEEYPVISNVEKCPVLWNVEEYCAVTNSEMQNLTTCNNRSLLSEEISAQRIKSDVSLNSAQSNRICKSKENPIITSVDSNNESLSSLDMSEKLSDCSVFSKSHSEYQPSTSYVSDTESDQSLTLTEKSDELLISPTITVDSNTTTSKHNKNKKSSLDHKSSNMSSKHTKPNENSSKHHKRKGRKTVPKSQLDTSNDSEEHVIVVRSAKKNKSTGQRVRDKGHCCLFCDKIMINIARHYELVHKNEIQVAKILIMPKGSTKRREAFAELSRTADFYHNCEVLNQQEGELILVRRPSGKETTSLSYSSYGPCPHCLGFMLKRKLWFHVKYNCKSSFTSAESSSKKKSIIADSNALLIGLTCTDYSFEYQANILNKFKNDHISTVCKQDSTILKFGYLQFQKHGPKGHCCLFCDKIMINIARHYELVHKNEIQVAKILIMPKGSTKRREAFAELSRTADFYHNCEVLNQQKGELILVRRPSGKETTSLSYSSYGPCPHCLGFMLKRKLWFHVKYNCKSSFTSAESSSKKKSIIADSNALLIGLTCTDYSFEYQANILNKFKNDHISTVCKQDSTILKFGYLQFQKHGPTQCELIRQTMRQLGRFLLEVKSLHSDIKELADCLLPNNFDVVISSVKRLCGTINSKE
uniref:Uncharacterized protein LOC114337106 n=1 Tax=Diabrotica virgifera virgifera TaxID=50390 RepID=A0A6P7GEC5_DIAVI